MKQQQLESKLALHTSLLEKLALTLAKVSYKHDYLITAIKSKREEGNFLEYTYEAWSEKDGYLTLLVTVSSEEDGVFADVESFTEDGRTYYVYI